MVTVIGTTGLGVVKTCAGTGTSNTVPFELATPPERIKLGVRKLTAVLFVKLDPVKCSVNDGVPAVVVGFVSVGTPRTGFITANGSPPFPGMDPG